jgi:integrase/recombinase XerD
MSKIYGLLDRTAINRIVGNAGELTGVKGLSPHWLRHAHASHALDKGAPVSLVSQTLGHASIATTSRYLHAKPGESSATYLEV